MPKLNIQKVIKSNIGTFHNGVYLLVGFFTEKKIRKDTHADTSLYPMWIAK